MLQYRVNHTARALHRAHTCLRQKPLALKNISMRQIQCLVTQTARPLSTLRESTQGNIAAIVGTGVGLLVLAQCKNEEDEFVDPLSGLCHPKVLRFEEGAENAQVCIGFGTRSISFMNFYVYSVALYVNTVDFVFAMEGYEPNKNGFEMDIDFRDRLLKKTRRTLRLTPYREAEMSHLREGFTRAVEIRIERGKYSMEEKEEIKKELATFRASFPRGNFKLKDYLEVSAGPSSSSLFLSYNGDKTEVEAPRLARILFESYIDETPQSTNAASSIKDGFTKYFTT
eukprot:m.20062 g.20062  ORF g.20062 m.20062 type:complete len:284 (-) comp6738_c0_seq1:99-950(-)